MLSRYGATERSAMKTKPRTKAIAVPRALGRAAATLTALLSLAAAYPAAAAPVAKAPAPVVVSPGAPPTAGFTPAPIVAVDAPQNKLHLTADQQTKANAIMAGFFQKRNALLANKSQTQTQRKASYVALAQATHNQMLSILTPQQKAQLTQSQANQAQFTAGANAAQAKAISYSKQLRDSLTTAQKTKINGIEKAAVAKLQAMAANPKLTIQQREQQSSAIRAGVQTTIKGLLTPTQMAIYANVQRYIEQASSLGRLAQESGV